MVNKLEIKKLLSEKWNFFDEETGRIHETGVGNNGYAAVLFDYHRIKNGVRQKKYQIRSSSGGCHGFLGHHIGDVVDSKPDVVAIFARGQEESDRYFSHYFSKSPGISVEKYYQWMLEESPLREVFLPDQTAKSVIEQGLLIDARNPANHVLSAAIMSRHAHEKQYYLAMMQYLQEEGVIGNLAFIVGCFMSHTGHLSDEKFNIRVTKPPGGEHDIIYFMSDEAVKAFVEGVIYKEGYRTKDYRETFSYQGVHDMWRPSYADYPRSYFDSISDILHNNVTDYEEKRAFGVPVRKLVVKDKKSLVKDILNLQKEILSER